MSEAPRSRLLRFFDRPGPLLKQAPTTIALLVALALVHLVPGLKPVSEGAALAGTAVILAATAYAALLRAHRGHEGFAVLLIPMIDIVGLGLFRAGTGGAHSMFGALVLLPVVWLATAPKFRYVVAAVLLSSFTILMPYLATPPDSPADWLRGVVSPLVYAAVAAVIHDLSRQQRIRIEQAERLVSERTRALEQNAEMIAQLRESEQRYRALLESFESLWAAITAQAVIAIDCRGTVEAWNPGAERLLGLTQAEALDGVRIDRFFPADVLAMLGEEHPDLPHPHAPEDLPQGVRALFARADSDSTVDADLEISTATGLTVPARITVTPRKDGTGQQRGYLLVVTDETRAVEVARMKDQFVGMISHELRTPLSAIIGFLDLLRSDPERPLAEEQREFVDIIERNAQRLLALVGDLLFTAQVESGRFPLECFDSDLSESVRSAVESAAPHAQREGVELRTELPDRPVVVSIDARRIGQALDNLLSNAIKFTPRGGRVTAEVRPVDGAVVLAVRDTGIGIPEDEQGMLFTRFFRASTATRNAVPGIGLGLSITRAIVIAHGGRMEVASREGEGTEFRMTLPMAPPTEAVPKVRIRAGRGERPDARVRSRS
ncbi:PAS domain-containing sensor histidine kinase [Leucobacter iarius]|uniref:histidine kinase n=1 Tax=Leucobacter iarius TaxID=333963 RepID=A0ABN2LT06_9MICO